MRLDDESREEDAGIASLLSPAGLARREAMLGMLKREVVRRLKRRRAARWGALAVLLGLGAVPLAVAVREQRRVPPAGTVAVKLQEPAPEPGQERSARIEVIADRPGIVERYRVRTAPPREGVRIGDEELLSILADAGRPSGLIRVGGAVILTPDVAGGL